MVPRVCIVVNNLLSSHTIDICSSTRTQGGAKNLALKLFKIIQINEFKLAINQNQIKSLSLGYQPASQPLLLTRVFTYTQFPFNV